MQDGNILILIILLVGLIVLIVAVLMTNQKSERVKKDKRSEFHAAKGDNFAGDNIPDDPDEAMAWLLALGEESDEKR